VGVLNTDAPDISELSLRAADTAFERLLMTPPDWERPVEAELFPNERGRGIR
jgi:hypothetical protein